MSNQISFQPSVKSCFIISPLKRPEECFNHFVINEVYHKEGLTGIYLFLERLKTLITTGKTQTIYLTSKMTSCREIILTKLIYRSLRERYLHRCLVRFFKDRLNPPKEINKTDLCYQPFYSEEGCKIRRFIGIVCGSHIFNFSKTDIENIMSNCLENREHIRPTPQLPKNPYNGNNFNIYELKCIYDFLLTNTGEKQEKEYNTKKITDDIPELIRLFRYSQFTIDNLQDNFGTYLEKLACQNYVHELSFQLLTRKLRTAFQYFEIHCMVKPESLRKYLELAENSTLLINVRNIISRFINLYHYHKLDNIYLDYLENQLSKTESEPISTLIKQLELVKSEIEIIANTRKCFKKYKVVKPNKVKKIEVITHINETTQREGENKQLSKSLSSVNISQCNVSNLSNGHDAVKNTIFQFTAPDDGDRVQLKKSKFNKFKAKHHLKLKTFNIPFQKIDFKTFSIISKDFVKPNINRKIITINDIEIIDLIQYKIQTIGQGEIVIKKR